MATPLDATKLLPVLLPIMVLLVLYGRIRRNVGRQVFKLRRTIVRLAVFSVLTLVIGYVCRDSLPSLGGLACGILVGVPLGLVGMRLTNFEATEEGRFYRPNTYIGIAISLLLVGRFTYRLALLRAASLDVGQHMPNEFRSPLTLSILGILAGYYIFYNVSLLVLHRRMRLATEEDG